MQNLEIPKIVWIAFFTLFFGFDIDAQIVNIEEKRLQSKNGWMGSIDLEFSFTKNKEEIIELENNIQVGYKSGRNLYLFLNEIEVIKSGDNDVLNNGFQHIRYNYSFTGFIVLEAFAQYQFNQIQEIDKRILLGVGPRLNLLRKDSIKAHVGIQVMKEWEKTTEFQDNYRSSNYLALFWDLSNTVDFISTTYYQPLIKNFDDYRLSNESSLLFSMTKNFRVSLSYEVLYDTEVPEGVPSTLYSFNTGVVYSL